MPDQTALRLTRRGALVAALGVSLLAGCGGGTTPAPSSAPAPSRGGTRSAPRPTESPRSRPAPPASAAEREVPAEDAGPPLPGLTRLETAVLRETNRARQDPRGYADILERQLAYFDGRMYRVPGETPLRTEEGARAVREAIRVLRGLQPMEPLTHAPGLSRAARDLVRDQGRRGATGHTGSDGSSPAERVSRHGRWNVSLSENIAYGPETGRDVVVGLIVDDGVPDRGHRRNIFDPTLRVAGIACGAHRDYGMMCVIDYAGAYTEGPARAAAPSRRAMP